MNRKITCIVIALTVFSISAIIGARERFYILGRFSSTLNGVPVRVILSQESDESITTMRTEDLVENWADYDGRFVRFMGTVKSIDVSESKQVMLKVADIIVYPLDARNLPETYEEGHKYEFTGFLIRYEEHVPIKQRGYTKMRVYAFAIRHLGEAD